MSVRPGIALAAAAASGTLSLLPAPASAAPQRAGRPHAVGAQNGRGFASDGVRYVAFRQSPSEVRVFDGRTGKLFSIKTRCELLAGASGRFLVDCGTGPRDAPAPALLEVAKRKVVPLPGANPPYDGFFDMGDQWVLGTTYHPEAGPDDPGALLYLNWHTGERVERPRDEQTAPTRDVDSPSLASIGPVPFANYLLFGYQRPWSAVRPLGKPSARSPSGEGALQLVSGGHRRVLSKTPCGEECGEVAPLVRGRLAWAEPAGRGVRVRSYTLKGARRASWTVRGPFPDPERPAPRVEVGQTARYVVYAKLTRVARDPASGQVGPSRYRVYAARR